MQQKGVEAILNLNPPLESGFSTPRHEHLAADRMATELAVVREQRESEPRAAMINLAEVLETKHPGVEQLRSKLRRLARAVSKLEETGSEQVDSSDWGPVRRLGMIDNP